MRCAWKELIAIVPPPFKTEVDKLGAERLQELRFRVDRPPELVMAGGDVWLSQSVTMKDLQYVINAASQYSPWAATTITKGYLTATGGHRIGICGEAVVVNGVFTGMRDATSLCIRVARDIPNAGAGIELRGNTLIVGPPGSGKTTLLRNLCRKMAESAAVVVVDERQEIFPKGFATGRRLDVLHGCSKDKGIEMALRTMGPDVVAVDEITAIEDANALESAGWCGVDLVATAHASDLQDLQSRTIYKPILECELFHTIIILKKDKSWRVERLVS